jgi:pyruvate/2-oxoglutarate dehydrogenase complex dihydrolipoamide acyltransferase (E2) component
VSSSRTDVTTLVDVTMPQMGVSVAEGTVVEWRKRLGDWVEADEIIASISTDKIDTDVESPATGRVQEILVQVGATVEVGTVLARIATDAKPGEAHQSETPETGTGEATAALEAPNEAGELTGDQPRPRRYSPVVMRIAAEHKVDLEQVEGTGRGGRVRKQDVLAYIENGQSPDGDPLSGSAAAEPAGGAPAQEPPLHIESPYKPEPVAPKPAAPAAGAPLSRMRQAIGQRMLESLHTAATCTTVIEADMSRIEAARRRSGFTYLPYVARATIETLREITALNATLEGESLTTYDAVHLGIAVSLGQGGLIVPVIRDAQNLSVEGLAERIRDLAQRARANQLQPDEVRGGTFTITNPGGYGSIMATPVINQPQVAILDTEAVVKRPVVVTDELGNDSIAIRPMTFLCMSWDHRALDGALAAQFLAELRKKLEAWPITPDKV